MHIRSFLIAAAVAAMAFGSAVAGPFTAANNAAFNAANTNYSQKYEVPDFSFTKAEFGNTDLGQLIHLGAEVVVETVLGATVVYNPAIDQVDVYVNGGSGFNGKIVYASSKCKLLSGRTALGNPGPDGICLPAETLAGSAGGIAYSHTNPAVARSCTFDAASDGNDVHRC